MMRIWPWSRLRKLAESRESYREVAMMAVDEMHELRAELARFRALEEIRIADAERAARVAVAASRVFDRLSNEIGTRLSLDVDEHAAVVQATRAHPFLPAALELAHEVDRNPQFHQTAEADLLLRLAEYVAPVDHLGDAVNRLF